MPHVLRQTNPVPRRITWMIPAMNRSREREAPPQIRSRMMAESPVQLPFGRELRSGAVLLLLLGGTQTIFARAEAGEKPAAVDEPGMISGTVSDGSGRVLVGAAVSLYQADPQQDRWVALPNN